MRAIATAERLGLLAVEAALRHIRRTSTLAPTCAEVLKVLRSRMQEWSDYVEMINHWDRQKRRVGKIGCRATS